MDTSRQNYKLVDPSNRMVADELESDWNQKILDFRQAKKDYERERSRDQMIVNEDVKKQILALTSDLPKLWNSSTTEDRDRKRIVRLLINDVTLVKREKDITVKIRFKGGAIEETEIARPESAWMEKKHSPDVIEEIDRLLEEHTDGETASIMNTKGHSSGTGKVFDARRISVIRRAYGITSRMTRLRHQGLLTIAELCEKFSVNRHKIYDLRGSGKLISIRYDDVGRYMYKITDESIFNTKSKGGAV